MPAVFAISSSNQQVVANNFTFLFHCSFLPKTSPSQLAPLTPATNTPTQAFYGDKGLKDDFIF